MQGIREDERDDFKSSLRGIIYALPIILVFTGIYGYMYAGFNQIPGPMYGGDFYFHYGIINNIFNGNPPWTCSQVQGEYAFYPWLLHLSVAMIGTLTGDLSKSFILYFPVMVVLASGALFYLLGKALYRDEKMALLLCLGWLGTRAAYGYIPANFTPAVTFPLFFLATYYATVNRNAKWITAAGISLGLFIMSHASALPAALAFLSVLFVYEVVHGRVGGGFDPEKGRIDFHAAGSGEFISAAAAFGKVLLPLLLIGIAIGTAYWAPIIGVYHFDVKTPWNEFTQPDFEKYGNLEMKEIIFRYLFNTEGFPTGRYDKFLLSLLTLAGLLGALKGGQRSGRFIAAGVLAGFIGYMHYFVTLPLLGTTFAPMRIDTFMLNPSAFLAAVYGVHTINGFLKTTGARNIFTATIFIFFILTSNMIVQAAYTDQWSEVGRAERNAKFDELTAWVEANTDKNAVFLSHQELSFALNGVTGRKIVILRRTHFNPYLDINEREADAGVMLYGNDSGKTLELLRKYNVSYVYWDLSYLALNQFALKEPFMTLPEYGEYLSAYGVSFQPIRTYLDPAYGERYKTYEVLAILPAKGDAFQPWSDEFQKHVRLAKEVTVQNTEGQDIPYYRIFEIDYDSF